jgi:heme a synthase
MVWGARDGQRYRKLVAVLLFLTFDLIVFGAFTRLTDSGLGCPDWPGCYGHANPLQAVTEINNAQAVMPDGPVTWGKAWIEMIHRYLAAAIGVLIIALVVAATRLSRRTPREPAHSPLLPYLLLFFVCVQGAFGAWTVTLKLQPIIVTIHLLLGMGLLAMIALLHARQTALPVLSAAPMRLRALAAFGLVIAFMQIALGGWVSTNYAPLACLDYPTCQGAWLPEMDWQHGFSLWRELGKTSAGDYLPFPALTAIHWLHRNFALLVVLVVGSLAWQIRITQPKIARSLAAILTWQFASGIATIFLKWPLAIALAHNAGAAALVLSLTVLNYRVSHRVRQPVHAG